jgi:hypothetical protein
MKLEGTKNFGIQKKVEFAKVSRIRVSLVSIMKTCNHEIG